MYHLFGYNRYYPNGGMSDYIESFDTIEETKEGARATYYENYEIVTQREGDYINPAKLAVIECGTSNGNPLGKFTIKWESVES